MIPIMKLWKQAFVVFVILTILYVLTLPNLASYLSFFGKPPTSALTGQWAPRVLLPLIPVAVAVLPNSGRVLIWAADKQGSFGNDTGRTVTAVYDPLTCIVTSRNVSVTKHNMFCPGLSLDFFGRPIVTGGHGSKHTSIYHDESNSWTMGPNMTIGRGYHAQTTISDGRIFTIGGSWSGGIGGKSGEIFDPLNRVWTGLPGCPVEPMLTNDPMGAFSADNHAWLFAWRQGSVFQAGPSAVMNWYSTYGNGTHSLATQRGRDGDAMNGNAVMYDAGEGKILTLGGAPTYSFSSGTKTAHIITLSAPFSQPRVEDITPMHFPRVFANSVVLPTGDVFINGGASFALQWTDSNATWIPEMWSPKTRRFTRMQRNTVPRTYHSVAILLPDATVLTGGGGLCWEPCDKLQQWKPSSDHFDLQIFIPPYLFAPDGKSRARRPKIVELSENAVELGTTLIVLTDVDIIDIALVRYGSATHSINTDQRRIRLDSILISPGTTMAKDSPLLLHDAHAPLGTPWEYQVQLPDDPGVALPGYWMLFAINSLGVPSVAETIRIKIAGH